jgi:hypothetical protein
MGDADGTDVATNNKSEPKLASAGEEEKLCCDRSDDVDDLAAALRTELDRTSGEGEQCVVATTSHVHAGVEVRAALANDDLARLDDLATEALDAEVLRVGIATVT